MTRQPTSLNNRIPLSRFTSRWRFIACVQATDFILFWFLGLVWLGMIADVPAHNWQPLHIVLAVLVAVMVHCVFQAFHVYDFATLARGWDATLRTLAAGFVSSGALLAPLLVRKDFTADAAAAAGSLIAAVILCIGFLRFGIAHLAIKLQRAGLIGRRIYIIATDTISGSLLRAELERHSENNVVGIWDLSTHPGATESSLAGAVHFLQNNPVDVVILRLPLSQTERVADAARILRSLPRTVLLAPSFDTSMEIISRGVGGRAVSKDFGDIVMVKLSDRPLAGWRWVLKDLQDRVLALLLLVAVSPVMLAIAVAIKLSDPGPLLFRQERRGYGGRTFRIKKFRTMKADQCAPDKLPLKLVDRDDPRVFPVGRFLRKTSLDELPQLFNVLVGDMWIIGPRPHALLAEAGGIIYPHAVQEYTARYRIKPGITGWAQVCGWRGPTDTLDQLRRRVEHDLYYIENWSTTFDAMILFKTLFCIFGHKNAF